MNRNHAVAALNRVPIMENSMKFGKLWGIEIGAHTSWLLIFGVIVWSFGTGVYPRRFPDWNPVQIWAAGTVTTLLFFASVLIHELAHARVAIHFGLHVKRIVLFLLGGMAQMGREAPSPRAEFWIAIVGPISSLILAGLFFGLAFGGTALNLTWIRIPALELGGVNLVLGLFNMIPGFPLDGGRVLRSIVWRISGDLRNSTRVAAWVGQFLAFVLVGMGLALSFNGGGWLNGFWFVFIGVFVFRAALAANTQAALRESLRGVPVTRIMTRDFGLVPPDISVQTFVDDYLARAPHRSFLVAEAGRVEGVITLDELRKIPWHERDRVRLKDAMAIQQLPAAVDADEDVEGAFWEMAEKDVGQLPVTHDGDVVGLVTRSALMQFVETRSVAAGKA